MGAIDGNEGYEVDFIARGVIRGLGRPVILAAWNLNAFRFTRGRGGGSRVSLSLRRRVVKRN